jgi:hypothetical protein
VPSGQTGELELRAEFDSGPLGGGLKAKGVVKVTER